MQLIINFFTATVELWLEISPYFLLGAVIAGLIHVFLAKEFISRQLGSGGIWSIIKATLLGVPLPVCSCGVIPLAASLRRDGAHKSSVLSFLVSTPTTGVDSMLASYALLGPLFAIFRPLASLVSGLTLGLSDYWLEGRQERLTPMPRHEHQAVKPSARLKEFIRYTFLEIPQDIGKWLLIGTFAGGLISSLIPQTIFTQYISFPWDFVAALLVGIPLYVCATGSIPVAASLMAKGISPGAALVFLIAGPATNAITLSFVRAKLGRRSFYLYIINITVVAVTLGIIFNYLWSALGNIPQLTQAGAKMLPQAVKAAAGVALFILVANVLLHSKASPSFVADLVISVPDIHCQHCKITLQESLSALAGVEQVAVDLEKKQIKIKGKPDQAKLLDSIKQAGYHPQA